MNNSEPQTMASWEEHLQYLAQDAFMVNPLGQRRYRRELRKYRTFLQITLRELAQ